MGNGKWRNDGRNLNIDQELQATLVYTKHQSCNNHELDISCVRSGPRDYVSGRNIPRNVSPVQRVSWSLVLLSYGMVYKAAAVFQSQLSSAPFLAFLTLFCSCIVLLFTL